MHISSWASAETSQAGRITYATIICFATGLLQVVKQYVKIPVYAMIRPRGGDFLYSDQEVEVMRKDIEVMKSHGADGLVLGALTEDGRVDTELCMELLGNACIFDLYGLTRHWTETTKVLIWHFMMFIPSHSQI